MPAICMAPALITAWTAVARKTEEAIRPPARQLLHHADFHAALRRALQLHVVHEAAHEEDAAAARLQHVLGRERVGDLVGLEAFALVGHADDQLGRRLRRA